MMPMLAMAMIVVTVHDECMDRVPMIPGLVGGWLLWLRRMHGCFCSWQATDPPQREEFRRRRRRIAYSRGGDVRQDDVVAQLDWT